MTPNVRFEIKKLSCCFGWYSGNQFSFINMQILEMNDDFCTIFSIQIAKFCIQVLWNA